MRRLNPFEHAFAALAAQHFPEIRDEAASLFKDTADLPQFASLGTVQRMLEEFESPGAVESDPDAPTEYIAGLYAAYRFWDCGETVCAVTREEAQRLLTTPSSHEPAAVPNGACYIQLPEQLFWTQIDPTQPHEPVDGFFVIEGAHRRELLLLFVLGLRVDRPGFSQVSLVVRPDDLTQAIHEARTPFFTPTLDGGVSAGLKSLVTEADVLLLAQLALQVVAGE